MAVKRSSKAVFSVRSAESRNAGAHIKDSARSAANIGKMARSAYTVERDAAPRRSSASKG